MTGVSRGLLLAVAAIALAIPLAACADSQGGAGPTTPSADDRSGTADAARAEGSGEAEDGIEGVALPEPLEKPDVTLVDAAGEPWSLREETDGHLTFLFFGYTSCPDICPVHMANLTSVFDRLPSTVTDRIRVVFVSTDPARDTPERMAEFMSAFDEDFVGVTGDLEDVAATMRALDLPEPVHEEPDDSGFYEVGHPAQLIAFTPDDDLARYAYPWGKRQQDFMHDIPELLARDAALGDG